MRSGGVPGVGHMLGALALRLTDLTAGRFGGCLQILLSPRRQRDGGRFLARRAFGLGGLRVAGAAQREDHDAGHERGSEEPSTAQLREASALSPRCLLPLGALALGTPGGLLFFATRHGGQASVTTDNG